MPRKTGQSRIQYGLFATPLDDLIAPDNMVRVIDAFVDTLDLAAMGFKTTLSSMGAASYDPAVLLKIYFYGYLNRIRSSRMLERECTRNIELFWLTDRQTPSYHTISTFRTFQQRMKKKTKYGFVIAKLLKSVFRYFVDFCNAIDMLGKTDIAIDGTKIAAQNSKKQHISEEKIKRKLDRVENRITEYLEELDLLDKEDMANETPDALALLLAISDMDVRQQELEQQKVLLDASKAADPQVSQICLTDPEARMLPINNEGMMQIAYNVQSVVDDKNKLIVDFSVENQKDIYLLAPVAIAARDAMGLTQNDALNVLADKGYHAGKGLHECAEAGITTYVAFPELTYRDRPKGFQKVDFEYNAAKDEYTCPNKKRLKTRGAWHEKYGRNGQSQARFKLYRSPFAICSTCPFKDKCLSTGNIQQRHGRTLERSEYEEATIENRKRILRHRDKYKRRQAIVEHPFGTIKRSWGAYYTLLRGKEKVGGEMAIVFTVYNMRRLVSILEVELLIAALKARFLDVFAIRRAVAADTRKFRHTHPREFRVDRGAEGAKLNMRA